MKDDTLKTLKIDGFRIEETEKDPEIDAEGVPVLRANTVAKLRLFGFGFTEDTIIGVTMEKSDYGKQCNKMSGEVGYSKVEYISSKNVLVELRMPTESSDLYLCASMSEDVR